jgi:hypothetical protein
VGRAGGQAAALRRAIDSVFASPGALADYFALPPEVLHSVAADDEALAGSVVLDRACGVDVASAEAVYQAVLRVYSQEAVAVLAAACVRLVQGDRQTDR